MTEADKHRAEWVKALESGEYKVAVSKMADIHDTEGGQVIKGHCCLGVATVEYAKAHGYEVEYFGDGNIAVKAEHYDLISEGSELPFEIREYYGLSEAECSDLAAQNDNRSEYPIADIVAYGDIKRGVRQGVDDA